MPNNTRIPLCPFYKDEKNKSISCEDTYRGFPSVGRKYAWMDMYCDGWDWMKCPYAVDLCEAYDKFEKGDDKALEKHEREAMRREMKSLSTKLGKAEKRIERQQKKIDELRAVNQSFITHNDNLESQKQDYYKRWREAEAKIKKGDDKVLGELNKLGSIYEQRMCYLMDRFAEGFFCESDAATWAEDKEFALVSEYDEELGDRIWKVVFEADVPKKSEE